MPSMLSKKPVIAAIIAALSLTGAAGVAEARSHDRPSITLDFGHGGVRVEVDKGRHYHRGHSRHYDHGYERPRSERRVRRTDRRDVRRAERRLAREERELDRAIRYGAPRWVIREERRDVRRARRALRRERRDLH